MQQPAWSRKAHLNWVKNQYKLYIHKNPLVWISTKEEHEPVSLMMMSSIFGLIPSFAGVERIQNGGADQCSYRARCRLNQRLHIERHRLIPTFSVFHTQQPTIKNSRNENHFKFTVNDTAPSSDLQITCRRSNTIIWS